MLFDRRIVLLVSCVAAGVVLNCAAAAPWQRYVNGRYGFSIEYPPQFHAGEEPVNGDGRSFAAPDGTKFSVDGELNNPGGQKRTILQFEAYLRGGDSDYSHVSYRAANASSLVLSGLRGDEVFYEKYVFSQNDQLIDAFAMTYKETSKPTYDPIVTRMAFSFRPGKPLGNWK